MDTLRTTLVLALAIPLHGQFTLEQIRANPFPDELTAAASGSRIAWTFNQNGQRNIWVAEGTAASPSAPIQAPFNAESRSGAFPSMAATPSPSARATIPPFPPARVAYERQNAVWTAPLDGGAPAKPLFFHRLPR